MRTSHFGPEVLRLNPDVECARIVGFIRESIVGPLRKRGAVVAVSGGVDSSTTLALCVKALGPERVFALLMPERESDPQAVERASALARRFRVQHNVVDITSLLQVAGCYEYRDAAIREVFAHYRGDYKCKISLATSEDQGPRLLYYNLIIESPDGEREVRRLSTQLLRRIVAATNMKQRTRKGLEYFHADRLNYAVVGTANLLEHDQGFFVKLGDGAADLKPLAHLYKTQVYALANYLDLPSELSTQIPSSDTYSLSQSQEEFFFGLPLDQLDLLIFGSRHGYVSEVIAEALNVTDSRVRLLLHELRLKRTATQPLHISSLMLEPRSYC